MSSKPSPKLGIYFSHYGSLGHTSRVMAVGEVFNKRFPRGDLFFIQAGVRQPEAKIDRLGKVYPLPGAFMDRRSFRGQVRGAGADRSQRADRCMDIVTRERPDLLMTEFFPLGWDECRHELIPPLVKASAQGAALWGVAGYPLLTGTNSEWRQKIFELYQRIIIFSPPREKEAIADSFIRGHDRKKYLDFFERHGQKITFAGYLLPQQEVVRDDIDGNVPKPPVPKGACRVAVLRGGGAVYPKMIAQAIRASDLLGKEYHLTVVSGPSTTPQEWDLFTMLMGQKKVNNVALLRSMGDYEGLIKRSDVCVSLASYHSSVMLLKHRKKALLVPFEGYGSKSICEQPARAAMLKEMLGTRTLSIQDLTAKNLAAAIKNIASCQEPSTEIPKGWFAGADVLDNALKGLFRR